MLIYEGTGGMRSVAWTDAMQGMIFLVGFILMFIISYTEYGGM
jgi:Na+/proline symporter